MTRKLLLLVSLFCAGVTGRAEAQGLAQYDNMQVGFTANQDLWLREIYVYEPDRVMRGTTFSLYHGVGVAEAQATGDAVVHRIGTQYRIVLRNPIFLARGTFHTFQTRYLGTGFNAGAPRTFVFQGTKRYAGWRTLDGRYYTGQY